MKDWTGNKVSVHHMLGVSKDGSSEREQHDFYATEPKATFALIENFLKHTYAKHYRVWEPACGMGNISEVLIADGYDVVSTDLIDRGFGKGGVDFLKQDTVPDGVRTIITNPPYRHTNEFIKHAHKILPYQSYLCLLLNINQLAGKQRYNEIYKRIKEYIFVIFFFMEFSRSSQGLLRVFSGCFYWTLKDIQAFDRVR